MNTFKFWWIPKLPLWKTHSRSIIFVCCKFFTKDNRRTIQAVHFLPLLVNSTKRSHTYITETFVQTTVINLPLFKALVVTLVKTIATGCKLFGWVFLAWHPSNHSFQRHKAHPRSKRRALGLGTRCLKKQGPEISKAHSIYIPFIGGLDTF